MNRRGFLKFCAAAPAATALPAAAVVAPGVTLPYYVAFVHPAYEAALKDAIKFGVGRYEGFRFIEQERLPS